MEDLSKTIDHGQVQEVMTSDQNDEIIEICHKLEES